MKIAVLGGAGLMGRITVQDLLENPDIEHVTVGELHRKSALAILGNLKDKRLKVESIDIKQHDKLVALIKGHEVVINSTPYLLNLEVMKACLEARVHYLDLGGLFKMTQRQLELSAEFKKAGLIAVLGCGSTPGTTNIMAGYAAGRLDEVVSAEVKIGCADFSRSESPLTPPYTMDTILDEFSLNPVIFEGGKFREVPPLSGEEEVIFPSPVGIQTACYTIHSEVATFPLSFKEKGIKRASFRIAFPVEFYNKIKFLAELGFASDTRRTIHGVEVSPRKFLLSLISELPSPEGDADDCDVIRVEVHGKKNGLKVECRMESIVRPHSRWKVSAGALDTGVPASIIAQMIADGQIRKRGVLPPEVCVDTEQYFKELALREMKVYSVTREEIT
ncbi:MAG: saccharopine dehydrogenase NADP-binding domain-containing protein [Candidatus Eremiobacteraeota bacterium]|nr:saccharopine dehydrogenase NADP-binding domain-containing protein [Candidatus Eremiobacteraeota bacterium]